MTADLPVTDTAIIGTGFIGRAWAISFARAGANVRLWDQADVPTARPSTIFPASSMIWRGMTS